MHRTLVIALLVAVPSALVCVAAWTMQEVSHHTATSPDGRFTATVTHRIVISDRPVWWRVHVVEHATGEEFARDFVSTPFGEELLPRSLEVEWRPRGAFTVRNFGGGTRRWFVELRDWPRVECERHVHGNFHDGLAEVVFHEQRASQASATR